MLCRSVFKFCHSYGPLCKFSLYKECHQLQDHCYLLTTKNERLLKYRTNDFQLDITSYREMFRHPFLSLLCMKAPPFYINLFLFAQYSYEGLAQQMKAAKLSYWNNKWNEIFDFTPNRDGRLNYTLPKDSNFDHDTFYVSKLSQLQKLIQ